MTEKLKVVPVADAKQARLDRWINQTNKFGSVTDPISRTSFYRDVNIDRYILESLYRYDWVTRRAIEVVAQDATREWIILNHDNPKRLQEAEDELERIDARGLFEEAIIIARLYGGCTMILGAFDGGAPEEPLTVPKRPTLFVSNLDRYLSYPQTFYSDPMNAKYGDVETYLVHRPHMHGSDVRLVHETRVIRFDGNYLPPLERIKNFTYGASVVENIFEALRNFGVANQSSSAILQDFITKKLKIANLMQLLDNDEGESMLLKRLGIMAAEMSINNLAVYGEDEEMDKMGTPVSGLPDLVEIQIDITSAATGIPKSRLFHNQTGRLGGDAGANDLRNHYDNVASFQKTRLRAKVQRFLDVILAPLGFEPGEIGFEFAPLWQLSEEDQAEVRLKIAQADEIYIRNGVVEPEEVALSRFSEEGINLDDMHIAVKPRQSFVKELEKAKSLPEKQPAPVSPEEKGEEEMTGAQPASPESGDQEET